MTDEERETLDDTLAHIRRVQELLHDAVSRLLYRSRQHDDTKLEDPEFSQFVEVGKKLVELDYGSEAYEKQLEQLDEALQHHYDNHRHHPEHWPDGIQGMTLLDLTEMLVDWKAASERHADGDIHESIRKNKSRFGYGDELEQILHQTASLLFGD